MSPTERVRQILPFAGALYLAVSVAHLQAKPPEARFTRDGLTIERLASGLKWHVREMARNEQAEFDIGFKGN